MATEASWTVSSFIYCDTPVHIWTLQIKNLIFFGRHVCTQRAIVYVAFIDWMQHCVHQLFTEKSSVYLFRHQSSSRSHIQDSGVFIRQSCADCTCRYHRAPVSRRAQILKQWSDLAPVYIYKSWGSKSQKHFTRARCREPNNKLQAKRSRLLSLLPKLTSSYVPCLAQVL